MQARAGFADVSGTRLHYDLAGAGRPLVLIHGFSLDSRLWDDQFAAFAQRHLVLRYDLRGFGRSAPPGGEPYAHADDLRALLEHLGVGPVVLLGLSLGGGIAIDFALEHPDLTGSLIPVDAMLGGYRMSVAWDASVRPIWRRGRAGDLEGARAGWLDHPLFAPIRERPAAARFTRMVADYSGWHWLNRDPERLADPPAIQRLDRIGAPALVVVGERDLPDFRAIADLLAQRIPGARLAVLPGVGHLPNLEGPERFNDTIAPFLDGL